MQTAATVVTIFVLLSASLGRVCAGRRKHLDLDVVDCVVDGIVVNDASMGTLTSSGNDFFTGKDYKAAQACYQRALSKEPRNPTATLNTGLAQLMLKDYSHAQEIIARAIELSPEYAYAYLSLGNLHAMRTPPHFAEAVAAYETAHSINPEMNGLESSLGEVYLRQAEQMMAVGELRKAQVILQKVQAAVMPTHYARAMEMISEILRQSGDLVGAAQAVQSVLHKDPTNVRAMLSQAITHRTTGRVDMALRLLQRAATLDPTEPEVLANLALALSHSGRNQEAIEIYEKAVTVRPDFVEAYVTLGEAYANIHDYKSAIRSFKKALKQRPGYVPAATAMVIKRAYICDWAYLADGDFAQLLAYSTAEIDGHSTVERPAMTPFHALTLSFNTGYILKLAKAYAANAHRSAARNQIRAFTHAAARKSPKILRIGYLSCDFGDHPVGRLFAPVAGHHSSSFDITLYALNPHDGSPWRKHMESGVAHKFIDLSADGMAVAADRIKADGIDILVDLMGYTGGPFAINRDAIMAARPAPLAISMLGYPSTSGADFFDYIVTDRVITPPETAADFSEAFLYMPYSYQVNSQKEEAKIIGGQTVELATREQYGLPVDKVILSCFNSLYKIDPAILTVWANVLRRVPNSVLWLLEMPPQAKPQIINEAAARGLPRNRIVFSGPISHPLHLARAGLADLFLDTLNYNAHTTATDALWTGVPLVTVAAGDKMQSRVAAGLSVAAGFHENVVHNLRQYEEQVVFLAQEASGRVHLAQLRQRMLTIRHFSPYFDTKRWVCFLEEGLRRAWKQLRRKQSGQRSHLGRVSVSSANCAEGWKDGGDGFDAQIINTLFTEPYLPYWNRSSSAHTVRGILKALQTEQGASDGDLTTVDAIEKGAATSEPYVVSPEVLSAPVAAPPLLKTRDVHVGAAEQAQILAEAQAKPSTERWGGNAAPSDGATLGQLKRAGKNCFENNQCASSTCKKRCCNQRGIPTACQSCDADGDCETCSQDYRLDLTECVGRNGVPWDPSTWIATGQPPMPSTPPEIALPPSQMPVVHTSKERVLTEVDDFILTQLEELISDVKEHVREHPAIIVDLPSDSMAWRVVNAPGGRNIFLDYSKYSGASLRG